MLLGDTLKVTFHLLSKLCALGVAVSSILCEKCNGGRPRSLPFLVVQTILTHMSRNQLKTRKVFNGTKLTGWEYVRITVLHH